MSSNFTLFQSDQNSATSGNAFDQDAFQDVSLPANSNLSFTDTISTNPQNQKFGNDDAVRYGAKTLYIKDLVLVSDHSLWIQGKPTYQIIWHENYPQAAGYIYGNINLVTPRRGYSLQTQAQKYVEIRQVGDGINISGVLVKCAFLVIGDSSATATAQLNVDGANTTTIDFSGLSNPINDESGNRILDPKYNLFVNSASNQTKDIHSFQLSALQTSTMRLVGVVVYSQNSGSNIDVFQGTTYNNKTKLTTTSGATLSLPAYTGNLGGRALYFKNASGYSGAIQPAPNLQSVATGSTGTNLLTVTTGTGASFPTGSGVAAFWGATGFLGTVTNQSTDTLTVSPTLSFGISGLIYKTFAGGQSLAINSSQLILSNVFDASIAQGFSTFYSEATGNYRVWGNAIAFTNIVDSVWPALICQNVSLGFLQVDGYFSGADIEFVGQGVLHATFNVNGSPVYSINSGQTGSVKKTVFTDAGPGWNSFNIGFGASYSAIGINKINLYQRALPQGYSFAPLALLDTLPNYVSNLTLSPKIVGAGTFHRYFADELPLQGGWIRSATYIAAGGIQYLGSTTNCALSFQYYGKNFAVLGQNNTQSLVITLDSVGTGSTLNLMNTVASEGFHTVSLTYKAGSFMIYGIDVARTQGEISNLQNFVPLSQISGVTSIPVSPSPQTIKRSHVRLDTFNAFASETNGTGVRFTNIDKYIGQDIVYNDDATTGCNFVIKKDGIYYVSFSIIGANAGGLLVALSLNCTAVDRVTTPDGIDPTNRIALAYNSTASGTWCETITWAGPLSVDDVIRPHSSAANTPIVAARCHFTISRIGD